MKAEGDLDDVDHRISDEEDHEFAAQGGPPCESTAALGDSAHDDEVEPSPDPDEDDDDDAAAATKPASLPGLHPEGGVVPFWEHLPRAAVAATAGVGVGGMVAGHDAAAAVLSRPGVVPALWDEEFVMCFIHRDTEVHEVFDARLATLRLRELDEPEQPPWRKKPTPNIAPRFPAAWI
jgi:hypothetical protein